MEQVTWLIPILAAVAWYGLFSRMPFARFSNSAEILETLNTFPGSEGDQIIQRGCISRFEYWKLRRRYDKYVLAQLGIKTFKEAAGMDVQGLGAGAKLKLKSGQPRKA